MADSSDNDGCTPIVLIVLIIVAMTCCDRLTDIRDRLPKPPEKAQ